ncbi:avidin-like [Crotalus adamanteus]|uniref:Avidin-like n=1 Tax=Crotalus adamanteus TaxID=8729 RepID=A0AAW1C349_CROAD
MPDAVWQVPRLTDFGMGHLCLLNPAWAALGVEHCSLIGRWVDDKGSKTVISHSNNAGVFSGFYLTALTATDNTIRPSPLHPAPGTPCFLDENGEEHLKTALLLPAEVGSTAEDWKATRAGRLVQPFSESLCQGPASLSNCSQDLWCLWEAPGPICSPRGDALNN